MQHLPHWVQAKWSPSFWNQGGAARELSNLVNDTVAGKPQAIRRVMLVSLSRIGKLMAI